MRQPHPKYGKFLFVMMAMGIAFIVIATVFALIFNAGQSVSVQELNNR